MFTPHEIWTDTTLDEVWLRYVSLGGSGDLIDIDAHRAELLLLDTHQQQILDQALWEISSGL